MRKVNRLTAKFVAGKLQPGYYLDGAGLYLQVSSSESKSWIFRFMLAGRSRDMGLGSLALFDLASARVEADACRRLLVSGVDPIEARNARRTAGAITAAKGITFGECALACIKAKRPDWKNPKHADQWQTTLETYTGPVFWKSPVQTVDTPDVLKVLEPIWTKKPETASRVRGRIETVLNWATVREYRTGLNPARWRGHLQELLPKLKKAQRVKHHPALPYSKIGAFMGALRRQEGEAAAALEFTILDASRTNEVIGAQPQEFDLDHAVWTIPANRMKGGIEHRVPLSPRAVEIVRPRMKGEYVFSGMRKGDPLSNMAMLELLKRMKCTDITVHGFRSTFRDWAAETTNYPPQVCEMALAHKISDAAEAAYRRGDLFEKRRRLMRDWAKYCDATGTAKVIPMRENSVRETASK